MAGKWFLGSRGTNPRLWDKWSWTELESYGTGNTPSLGDLANLVKWAQQGQHVRLEFLPDGAYGSLESPETSD